MYISCFETPFEILDIADKGQKYFLGWKEWNNQAAT